MNYAQTVLQLIYGGNDTRPEWQKNATRNLQEINWGYHPGRLINCIEISIHAYKTILLSQGLLKISVPALSNIPLFIPGYAQQMMRRLSLAESELLPVSRQQLKSAGSYQNLIDWLINKNVPAYSHLIILTKLQKLPGGHVISGIVLPSKEMGYELFLYDAQGVMPDGWLAKDQFDEFYAIEQFFVYQSEQTRQSTTHFLKQFLQTTPDNTPQEKANKPINKPKEFREKLLSFIKLELFRLSAKQIVSATEDDYTTGKINDYQQIYQELFEINEKEITYAALVQSLLKTAKIAKQHCYSYNWKSPQSLAYYKQYFQNMVCHRQFTEDATPLAFQKYLIQFLVNEITRICMVNETFNTEIEKKAEKLFNHLQSLEVLQPDVQLLMELAKTIEATCQEGRHTITFYSPESATAFNTYVAPILSLMSAKPAYSK